MCEVNGDQYWDKLSGELANQQALSKMTN